MRLVGSRDRYTAAEGEFLLGTRVAVVVHVLRRPAEAREGLVVARSLEVPGRSSARSEGLVGLVVANA
jgi:hypothetical protein